MNCIKCGKEFVHNMKSGHRIYCSEECRVKGRVCKLVCLYCGREFKSGSYIKYCSDACRKEGENSNRNRKKICPYCKKEFIGPSTQTFCSTFCRISYRNNSDKGQMRMYMDARVRANKRGLDFNIEVEDIVVPPICPVLGIPLFLTSGKRTNNSPSLDRIDPAKGYIKGNVCVISWRANAVKTNGTAEEHLLVSKYINRRNSGLV